MLIDIIGVPLDFGSGRRGVDMGPSAIRYAGLKPGLDPRSGRRGGAAGRALRLRGGRAGDPGRRRPARPKLSPQNVAIVGARDLDPGEKELLREAGVAVYSMAVIDRLGIAEVMHRAIEVASRGTEGIYLSVDLDVVDPMYAPGVGTPVTGGLTYREAHLAVELVAETELLAGVDLVEINPILDKVNMTGELAVQLALSAFGKRVWQQL